MLGTGEPRIRPLAAEVRAWTDGLLREVRADRLRDDVQRLPAPRSRLHAPDAMAQAETMLLDEFGAAGWPAERQPFAFTRVLGCLDYGAYAPVVYPRLEGVNIIATKQGARPSAAIVVLAHYDTVRDSPGADDNTAGVAALLELARLLAPYRFRHTIVLAVTDLEEVGFVGARAFAGRLVRRHRLLGVINFEAMAYTTSTPHSQVIPPGMDLLYRGQVARVRGRQSAGDFTAVIYNGRAARLAAAFAAGLRHTGGPEAPVLLRDPNDLPLVGRVLPRLVPVVRNFARSDHVVFWKVGVPAIQVTDTANFRNPHYHRPSDTPETLDYGRLAAIVVATAAALAISAGLLS